MNTTNVQNTDQVVKVEVNGQRWYEINGKRYISVTTVLDVAQHQSLNKWRENNSKAKIESTKKETANFGSELHHMVECDLNGVSVQAPSPELQVCFDHWLAVKKEKSISATFTEKTVYSDKYGYAGTLDIFGQFNGKPCVMDLKTGFYSVKAGWQLAAYRWAGIENDLFQEAGMAGIQIHRDGQKVNTFEYEHLDFCFRRFLECLNLFKGLYFSSLKEWPYQKHDALETYFNDYWGVK